jgi:hypothetical protein
LLQRCGQHPAFAMRLNRPIRVEPVDYQHRVERGNGVVGLITQQAAASVEELRLSRSSDGWRRSADRSIRRNGCRQAGFEVIVDQHRVDRGDAAVGIDIERTDLRAVSGRRCARVGLADRNAERFQATGIAPAICRAAAVLQRD